MADIVVKDILEAGIHYGHRTSRWNPKMRPYIYGRRNLIHIIDVESCYLPLRAKSKAADDYNLAKEAGVFVARIFCHSHVRALL